uniref:PCI domain-containing protein 2-like n=1 Tax=Rhizophora mucronata TaxID=61149 RepID=A0A2P2KCB3_RHIMU
MEAMVNEKAPHTLIISVDSTDILHPSTRITGAPYNTTEAQQKWYNESQANQIHKIRRHPFMSLACPLLPGWLTLIYQRHLHHLYELTGLPFNLGKGSCLLNTTTLLLWAK